MPGAEALSGGIFLVLVRNRQREINHRQQHENKRLDE
jgi:hypothetical protein